MKHTTFSWETIRDDVCRPVESPISNLIQHVIDSGLTEYLYPATMHNNLRIGRFKNFSRADGELTVEYNDTKNSAVFLYYDSEASKPWKKECKGEDIIRTLDHVLTKRLRWIKK